MERHQLKPPRRVYTVKLNGDGIHVANNQKDEDQLDVAWQDAQAAFRARDCVYLYITPARAFLLPDGQADCAPDALWAFIEKQMRKARRL